MRNYPKASNTFGKFAPNTVIIAIVEEQTNAAELDKPDPTQDREKNIRKTSLKYKFVFITLITILFLVIHSDQ